MPVCECLTGGHGSLCALSACLEIKMGKQSTTSNKLTVLIMLFAEERAVFAGDGTVFSHADGLVFSCL